MAITMATVLRCALKGILSLMAKLDLETSGESGGYSDSFEIEESLSLDPLEISTESDGTSTVAALLKKTHTSGTDTHKAAPSLNRTLAKPKVTTPGVTNSIRRDSQTNTAKRDDDDAIDFGRTIRSPLNMTMTKQGAATSADISSSQGKSGSKFKRVARNVRTVQSVVNTVKNFNDSLEVRDTVYGEWLARKTSQVSREKSSKVQAKKLEDGKKREKEVSYDTLFRWGKLNSQFIVTYFSILHAGRRPLFRFQTSTEYKKR